MIRLTLAALFGLAFASPTFADQDTAQEQRRAECTERANDRDLTNRQEFVDFCVEHRDVEVKRYLDCVPRAEKRDFGTDNRRSFLEWCAEQENYDDAQADRFSYCNSQASEGNLRGDDREDYIRVCVRR
jgi:hypothetical protein